MAKSESAIAEYMRIRRYVLTLTQKADGKSVPLPSILELSKQFQVSRPTVSRAMKALTEDGYVIGKRGIGAFTNPAKNFRGHGDQPIIGLILADGMNVHLDQYYCWLLGSLMMEISAIPAVVHLPTLGSHDPDDMFRTICNEQLDVLVWHGIREENLPVRDRLIESGLPVIISCDGVDSFGSGSARIGYREFGYECGKALIAEGRKNLVFLPAAENWMSPLPEIQRAYREAGITLNPNLFLSNPGTCLEDLRKLLAVGAPVDAVFNSLFVENEVYDILKEFRIDLTDQCRLIESNLCHRNREDFQGFTFEFPFRKHAERIAPLVKKALAGKALPDREIVTGIQLQPSRSTAGKTIISFRPEELTVRPK